jgi:3-hydroxybutyryl-CoA dehydrogenase
MNIQTVGVIGAGVMGMGVAQNLAQKNFRVVLLDVCGEALERARVGIKQNLRFHGLLTKGQDKQDATAVLERISFVTDYDLLSEAFFIIENVTEKWNIKQDVYQRLDSVCPTEVIFAANTSAIPITRIASATQRPANVIGIHFMNPVPLKNTVEVIRGYHTSPETIQTTKSLLSDMGKQCIIVNDSPGFVSNRVLMLTINEAIFLVHEQVASAPDVDQIFKSCFGHPMGPLETADLIGLDTILYSLDVLYESFNDSKFRPCPLLKKLVAAGIHGRKTGHGFYAYQ